MRVRDPRWWNGVARRIRRTQMTCSKEHGSWSTAGVRLRVFNTVWRAKDAGTASEWGELVVRSCES